MENNNNLEKIERSKKQKSTHFLITYHCLIDYDWQLLLNGIFATGRYKCVSGQLERSKKTGAIHVQAYLGAKSQVRGTQVLKDLPPGAWFKSPNKYQIDRANTGVRMHEYSIKDDTRESTTFLVLGEPPKRVDNSENGKRGREKQIAEYGYVLELAKRGEFDTIQREHPDLYLKHYTSLKRINIEEKKVEQTVFPYPYRDWQKRCLECIDSPDDRQVVWFYDEPGNSGKSTFLKWIAERPTAFYLDGGKKQDNIFLLKEHHTVLLIDLPRHGKDFVPYSTMETFKNGIWTSTKYEGNRVHRSVPGSVIVVANFLPDVTKLSIDRWTIYEIKRDYSIEEIRAIDLIVSPNRYQYL